MTDDGYDLYRRTAVSHAAAIASRVGGSLDHDELVALTDLCTRLRLGATDDDRAEGDDGAGQVDPTAGEAPADTSTTAPGPTGAASSTPPDDRLAPRRPPRRRQPGPAGRRRRAAGPWSSSTFSTSESPGIRPLGGAARWWLHHSLTSLDARRCASSASASRCAAARPDASSRRSSTRSAPGPCTGTAATAAPPATSTPSSSRRCATDGVEAQSFQAHAALRAVDGADRPGRAVQGLHAVLAGLPRAGRSRAIRSPPPSG